MIETVLLVPVRDNAGRPFPRPLWRELARRLLQFGGLTDAVWDHPLFQAVHDLEDRLGIQQGEMSAGPGDDLDRDPLADHWIPAARAAEQKGVSLPGLHGAIKRGDVIAKRSDRLNNVLVSANSLAQWTPNPVRQAARLGTADSRAS